MMKLQIMRLRLWRLVRHHFLSVPEMTLLTDMTVKEIKMMMEVSKEAEKFK